MYKFSIKCKPKNHGESKFPLTSYNRILATCCTSDANLFKIRFLLNFALEVMSTVTNLQPKVWNLRISHLSSSLSANHGKCPPITPTFSGNHKHQCNEMYLYCLLFPSLFFNSYALSLYRSTTIWAFGIRLPGCQSGSDSLISNNQSTTE